MRRKLQLFMLVAVIPMALALVPANAEAQRGRGRGAGGHLRQGPTVVVRGFAGGFFGYPYMWGPYWDPYWVGPYGGGWGYYGYRGYYDNSAELRLEVKPKEAQVYVDGYYAGVVDDFDGVFQRLHVSPGDHELVLYLNGYRTVKQNLHVGVNQDSRVKYQMAPVGAGEANEPPPQPVARAAEPDAQGYAAEPRRPVEPRRPAEPRRPGEPWRQAPPPPPDQEAAEQGQGFGSLVVRVQPAGADILIDGERWQGPEGSERLVIQLSEGSHKIEVRKEGYVPFSTTVRVRRGETAPVNVSLPPRSE
jgi:PEGA domain